MRQYIVDAFTSELFRGNPAAVCVMQAWPEESLMMAIARENNLSETAFIVKEEAGYHLRWFTPTTEVGLCGHATLASGFVVLNFFETTAPQVDFLTKSGQVSVARRDDLYELTFPNIPVERIEVNDDMARAFGVRPREAWLGLDLTCVFDDEAVVRAMVPDQGLIMRLPGRLHNATAPCSDGVHDCVSRSFAPKVGIAEDPVCGSAHCQIAPIWAKRLGKSDITAYQASSRGGSLYCHIIDENWLNISGSAVLFSTSELAL